MFRARVYFDFSANSSIILFRFSFISLNFLCYSLIVLSLHSVTNSSLAVVSFLLNIIFKNCLYQISKFNYIIIIFLVKLIRMSHNQHNFFIWRKWTENVHLSASLLSVYISPPYLLMIKSKTKKFMVNL